MSTPQSILVTGSSSGIGRRTSETLAQQGHTVFASMRDIEGKNAPAAEELRAWAATEKLALHVIELDVTTDASVTQAIQTIIAETDRIDVVINNAGIMVVGVSEALAMDQIQHLFEVNLFGAIRVNQAVLPHMRRQGAGLLIYLSSSAGTLVYPFMGVYGSSKAALEAVAETTHYEVFSLGIDTAIIQAGTYATSLRHNFQSSANQEVWQDYGMAGQIAQGFVDGFPIALSPENADDPQPVADLVARLVAMPTGQRPLKTTVGAYTEGIEAINQSVAPIQNQVLPGLGLDSLTTR